MQPHTKCQDNRKINNGADRFLDKNKSYSEESRIGIKNRSKKVLSADEKISILGDQNITIYGFLEGFMF